ncbi:GAF domain-containing protein [uncultured Parabacteroides sp.]|uniref:GAF domain-containing protein n=1 Tax=uncultured Parabacteroides sp. TaxID=512312 RepID=UPI0025D87A68|nr:GAF domain-containing protein [uncultured Parabacteroides sp.]
MAENLVINDGSKAERYETLIPQLKALTAGEPDAVANMANIAAALRQTFGFFWVGFYRVEEDTLVLGPFQGPLACTRIRYGKGVCGTAWKEARTIVVPDVDKFPGHIACNSASRSEIVVPVIRDGKVIAILDIDSDTINAFDKIDVLDLERINAEIVSTII